jgi:putative MATE family efflux protein
MEKNISSPLGTAPIGKLMFKLSLPTVVAQLVNLLYNIVDRVFIGHLEGVGADALTGVGLCLPLILIVNAFALLGAAGGAPRAAIALGQGNKSGAEKIMGNCFSLLLMFAVVLTGAYLAFAEPLLWMFGASKNTITYSLDYIRIYALGNIFQLTVLGLNSFLTTQGFSKFAMVTTLIGALMNLILDPILIYICGMGVRGAALATIISQAVSAVWVLWFLTKGTKTELRLRLANMKLEGKVFGPCLALGASGFVMLFTEAVLNISFNSSLSRYGGDLAVGSMTIISSCANLVLLPTSGICQGCQPITSFNFGAGNHQRVKKCVFTQIAICGGYATLFWVACMVAPQMFAGIFTSDPDLIAYTSWTMRVYMAGIFAMGFQTSCQQSFMAMGQSVVSLLLACLRKLVLLIPLIYILPAIFANKVQAVFMAEPFSDMIAAAVTVTVFLAQFNKILKKGAKKIGEE